MMNLMKLFRPSEKALEGTITIPDKSLSKSSIILQITLLMEQYIQDNKNLILCTDTKDYSSLVTEYNKLCNLGLENTKNARILKEGIDNFYNAYQNKEKAKKLIKFIKSLRNHFGESTLLISFEQFEKLCKKYRLETGLISEYTGIIPNKNIKEIQNVKEKVNYFNKPLNGFEKSAYIWKVTECENGTNDDDIFSDFTEWIKSKHNLIYSDRNEYNFDGSLWLDDVKNVNSDIPSNVKHYRYESLFKIRGYLIKKDTLFIACPPEQLKEQSLKITKKAIDPIVFQYSPYGIVVHSVWGEEAEDEVFEEYKRVNQLLSL